MAAVPIVGHDDKGLPGNRGAGRKKQLVQFLRRGGVQVAGRLVGKNDGGLV